MLSISALLVLVILTGTPSLQAGTIESHLGLSFYAAATDPVFQDDRIAAVQIPALHAGLAAAAPASQTIEALFGISYAYTPPTALTSFLLLNGFYTFSGSSGLRLYLPDTEPELAVSGLVSFNTSRYLNTFTIFSHISFTLRPEIRISGSRQDRRTWGTYIAVPLTLDVRKDIRPSFSAGVSIAVTALVGEKEL